MITETDWGTSSLEIIMKVKAHINFKLPKVNEYKVQLLFNLLSIYIKKIRKPRFTTFKSLN